MKNNNYNYEELNALYSRLKNNGLSEDAIRSTIGDDAYSFLLNNEPPEVDDFVTPTSSMPSSKNRLTKPGGAFDTKSGKFSQLFNNLANPQFDYNWRTVTDASTGKKAVGVQGWGKNLGGAYNVGNAAIQGIKLAKGAKNISNAQQGIRDTRSDILRSASNSPTLTYDLNSEQRDLLRQLRRGSYDSEVDLGDISLLGILGDAGMGALAGLPGGLPGAIIGGVGGALNSIVGDVQNSVENDAAELEALYQAVLESEQYHNQMRKQRAYANLY